MLCKGAIVVVVLSVFCTTPEAALCGRQVSPCGETHRPEASPDKPFSYHENISLSDGNIWCSYHAFSTDQLPSEYNDALYCVLGTVPQCVTVTVVIHKVESDGSLTWVEERKGRGQATTLPPVRDLKVTVESNSLLVSWENPIGVCAETHYILHYNGFSSITGQVHAGEQSIPSGSTHFEVKNVREKSDYKICVSAISAFADASKTCVTERAENLVPTSPQNLTVSNITATSAMLTWLPPGNVNGSLRHLISWVPCDKANVSLDRSVSFTKSTLLRSSSGNAFNITGLNARTEYCVFLQASNFLGFGSVATATFSTQDLDGNDGNAFAYAMATVVAILVLVAVLLCIVDCIRSVRKRNSTAYASVGSGRRKKKGSRKRGEQDTEDN